MSILEVDRLHKTYRPRGRALIRANIDLSVQVEGGHVLALLGHNGAGKSTLVDQVVGLTLPTAGTIRIDGTNPATAPRRARDLCSIQPQSHVPLTGLTPRRAIELYAQMRGLSTRQARIAATARIHALDLLEWADTPSTTLSGGIRRLLGFCLATAVPRPLVVLDEPSNDVDPARRRLLWNEVRAIADTGSAVLLVSHNLNEAVKVADRVAILDHGRLIATGTAADIIGSTATEFRVEVRGPDTSALPPHAQPASRHGDTAVYRVPSHSIGATVTWLADASAHGRIDSFDVGPARLEDRYLELVGEST